MPPPVGPREQTADTGEQRMERNQDLMAAKRNIEMASEDEDVFVRMLALKSPHDIPAGIRQAYSIMMPWHDRLVGGSGRAAAVYMVVAMHGMQIEAKTTFKRQPSEIKRELDIDYDAESGVVADSATADEDPDTVSTPETHGGDDETTPDTDLDKWNELPVGAAVTVSGQDGQKMNGKFLRVQPYGSVTVELEDGRKVDAPPAFVKRRRGRLPIAAGK